MSDALYRARNEDQRRSGMVNECLGKLSRGRKVECLGLNLESLENLSEGTRASLAFDFVRFSVQKDSIS